MRLTFGLLLAAIVTQGSSSADHAAITTDASSPAQGQISATGTYTVMAGYSLLEINLYAVPDEGGERAQTICTHEAKKLTWAGGPKDGLVSGTTYDVWAEITVYPNGNVMQTYTYTSKKVQQKVQ